MQRLSFPADFDDNLVDVCAGGTGQRKLGRGFVEQFGETEILDVARSVLPPPALLAVVETFWDNPIW